MSSPAPSLGHQMLRTASIFQGLAALVTGVFQTAWVIDLFFSYSWRTYFPYDAITAITTTLIAGIILFSALVETNPYNGSLSILVLEIVKSAGATALWLWLVLDAFFFPQRYNNADSRMRRITLSLVSVLILLVAFYPTLGFAFYNYRKERRGAIATPAVDGEQQQDEEADERQPLLRA